MIADGAVAYDAKPADMDIRKDSVNHGCRNGGPYYTKKATHKHLKGQPVGKNKKATVAGTQSLDGWWKSPKMNLRGVKSSCEDAVDARVAQSQWHHWIGDKDPWKTQGEVLKAVRDLQLLWRDRKTKLVSHVHVHTNADDDDVMMMMMLMMLMMMMWWWWWP